MKTLKEINEFEERAKKEMEDGFKKRTAEDARIMSLLILAMILSTAIIHYWR